MIIFHPPQAQPRIHKIGSTIFTVHAFFCGYESIYQKLASLMEAELLDSTGASGALESIYDNSVDFDGEGRYTVPDTMPLLSEGDAPGKEIL